MNNEVTNKIANALNLLAQANDAMIEAIQAAVLDEGEVSYEETIDESCGYTETRYIGGDEDDDFAIFDENGNTIGKLEDLTANELYDICVKIV